MTRVVTRPAAPGGGAEFAHRSTKSRELLVTG